jgi:hypothetical protein
MATDEDFVELMRNSWVVVSVLSAGVGLEDLGTEESGRQRALYLLSKRRTLGW